MSTDLLPHGARVAVSADLPGMRKLGLDADTMPLPLSIAGSRYWLVLDAPDGGIAAAAHVYFEHPRAYLSVIAVKREFANPIIGEHLLSVTIALCEMFGCQSLEMPAEQVAASMSAAA